MDTTQHVLEKELKQLHQDMKNDLDRQYKQEGDMFKEQGKTFIDHLQAQKSRHQTIGRGICSIQERYVRQSGLDHN